VGSLIANAKNTLLAALRYIVDLAENASLGGKDASPVPGLGLAHCFTETMAQESSSSAGRVLAELTGAYYD
jgi:hypothetical protein